MRRPASAVTWVARLARRATGLARWRKRTERRQAIGKSSKLYVGMDVHKDSIDVATGEDAAGEVRHVGAIGGEMEVVRRLCRKLESSGKALVFVDEAGPCGFGIYRMLRNRGTSAGWSLPA